MHSKRFARLSAAAALVALTGSPLVAEDYDATGEAGEYAEVIPSTLVRGAGGTYDAVTIYCPWIFDESDGLFNAAAVQLVEGEPLGAVTSFSGQGGVSSVAALGTVDIANPGPAGPPLVSNNIVLDEGASGRSNSIGTLIPDGTLVFRENFGGTAQNNIGFHEGLSVLPQIAFPEGTTAQQDFFGNFPGIDPNGGSVFLGTPGAVRDPNPPAQHDPADPILVGVTTFNAFGPDTINGVGVYRELATGADPQPGGQLELWEQADVTLASGILAAGESNSDVRQTQPVLANLVDPSQRGLPVGEAWQVHGIGISGGVNLSGGSAEPYVLAVDRVEDGDRYAGAVFIEADGGAGSQHGNRIGDPDEDVANANPAIKFLDHQATGGGTGVFVNSLFDINSSGQVVALRQDESQAPVSYDVVLYNPIWSGGRIIGYDAPTIVATNGQDGIEEVVATTQVIDNVPTRVELVPFSGVAIDNDGRVAFAAVTEQDVDMSDPNLPVLNWTTNSLFVWTPAGFDGAPDESLNIVAQGGQNGDTLVNTNGDRDLAVGFFPIDPQDAADSFSREGFSDEGGWLAINFRSGVENDPDLDGGVLDPGGNEVAVRGTLIISLGQFTAGEVGCDGDVNGDGQVDSGDISFIIFRLGDTGMACLDGDANGDGVVNSGDISYVIFRLGTCDPGGPCN